MGFPGDPVVKTLPANAGDIRDAGLITVLGRSPGEGKGYSLWYSGLENSMDYIVHGGRKELDTTEQFSFFTSLLLRKKIAPYKIIFSQYM